jgi:polyhydroxyalkanoate synthesis regulator phasin
MQKFRNPKNKVLNDGSVNEISLMKNRLNILMGEIDAGNDNPKIRDEIGSIVTHLVELGKISRDQAKEFISSFVANV